MATITGTNADHLLMPATHDKQGETITWLSAIKRWQKELAFFQTILDGTPKYFNTVEDKKKISRFQNLFMYYHAELLPELRKKLRRHESHLAERIPKADVHESPYFDEHEPLMSELEQFSKQFTELKCEFFRFIQRNCLSDNAVAM